MTDTNKHTCGRAVDSCSIFSAGECMRCAELVVGDTGTSGWTLKAFADATWTYRKTGQIPSNKSKYLEAPEGWIARYAHLPWEEEVDAHTALPRRGDEDLRECTDAPAFLIQIRRFRPIDLSELHWDSEAETLRDSDDNEITEEQAVDRELAAWEWDTQSVAFTRDEAQYWCDAHSYRGPWRVYSVPTIGDLRTLLRQQTDYEVDDAPT